MYFLTPLDKKLTTKRVDLIQTDSYEVRIVTQGLHILILLWWYSHPSLCFLLPGIILKIVFTDILHLLPTSTSHP